MAYYDYVFYIMNIFHRVLNNTSGKWIPQLSRNERKST